MSNSSTTYIGYSPYDFFYVDALTRGADYAPNDASCNYWLDENTELNCSFDDSHKNPKTGHVWFADTSFNCIQKQLCINKELAQSLVLETNNDGGSEKNSDNNYAYNNYLFKAVNLGIGICVILYLISKNNRK